MRHLLKRLVALAGREDATVNELVPGLPEAEAELVTARERVDAAEEAYRRGLVGADDAQLAALDAARREAVTKVDRAEALLSALRERLAEAQAREAEAERVARYEAARRQADDAAAALAEMYPALAGGIVELLEGIAKAEAEVRAVNADLPQGAVPLSRVERRIRDAPSYPEEVLNRSTEQRWVQVGQVRPGNFNQDAVRATVGTRGVLPTPGFPQGDGRKVEARTFTVERYLPAVQGEVMEGLGLVIHLPRLRAGDPDFFKPVVRDANGLVSPSDVLTRIAKLRGTAPRGEPTRSAEERLIPHDETPVRAPPEPAPYRPLGAPFA